MYNMLEKVYYEVSSNQPPDSILELSSPENCKLPEGRFDAIRSFSGVYP